MGTEVEDIERRNKRLKWYFRLVEKQLGLPKYSFSIVGNRDTPAVIYDDRNGTTQVMSCYVHNFELRFTDKPRGGKVVFAEKLLGNQEIASVGAIQSWMEVAEHRRAYTIGYQHGDLKLAGYNFIRKKGDPDERYPVFARYNYKYYFSEEGAQAIIDKHPEYDLRII